MAARGATGDAILKQNLFEPLGIKDTDVEVRPHMQGRLTGVKTTVPPLAKRPLANTLLDPGSGFAPDLIKVRSPAG